MAEPKGEKIITVTMKRRIPQYEHTCPVCGETFTGHKLAVYNKPECRAKAKWDRNKDNTNAKRRRKP
jgi:hypothetical protein